MAASIIDFGPPFRAHEATGFGNRSGDRLVQVVRTPESNVKCNFYPDAFGRFLSGNRSRSHPKMLIFIRTRPESGIILAL